MNIAIVVVAYNREKSTKRLLQSLNTANYTSAVPLIISIDKSSTDAVERYADSFQWKHGEKRVVKHRENLGLRKHVLSIGQYLKEYDAIVVLEDDITVAPSFMHYVQATVNKYHTDDQLAGISLYSFGVNNQKQLPFTPLQDDSDVYLMQLAQSWGQIWMKKGWHAFEQWYKNNNEPFHDTDVPKEICEWSKNSWLKYHNRYCIRENKFFVYPYTSFATNNGDQGEHFTENEVLYQTPLQYGNKQQFKLPDTDAIRVRYDAYYENMQLASHLGIAEKELTVDLYGGKVLHNRYLLSTKSLPFRIVQSYAMELRPWDANIIEGRKGEGIWLYDTSIPAAKPKIDRYSKYYYLFGRGFNQVLFMVGPLRAIRLIKEIIITKFRQK